MIKDQVIDGFIAQLCWEGVSENQINAALTHIENLRLGQSLTDRGTAGHSQYIRLFAQAAGGGVSEHWVDDDHKTTVIHSAYLQPPKDRR